MNFFSLPEFCWVLSFDTPPTTHSPKTITRWCFRTKTNGNLRNITTFILVQAQVCDESTCWPWPLTLCTWCLYQNRHQWNQNSSHFSNVPIIHAHDPYLEVLALKPCTLWYTSLYEVPFAVERKLVFVCPDNSNVFAIRNVFFIWSGVQVQRDSIIQVTKRKTKFRSCPF